MNAEPQRAGSRARGWVTIEFAAAVALLLFPVVVLVATLPAWSQRQHAAEVIARETARFAAQSYPHDTAAEVDELVTRIARNLGIDRRELSVSVTAEFRRGGTVRSRVTIEMPGIVLPGTRGVARWSWTTSHAERIDDYRSA